MAFYFQIQIVTSAVPSPTMGPTKKKRGEKADYHYYTAVENGRTFGDGKLFMDSFFFFSTSLFWLKDKNAEFSNSKCFDIWQGFL